MVIPKVASRPSHGVRGCIDDRGLFRPLASPSTLSASECGWWCWVRSSFCFVNGFHFTIFFRPFPLPHSGDQSRFVSWFRSKYLVPQSQSEGHQLFKPQVKFCFEAQKPKQKQKAPTQHQHTILLSSTKHKTPATKHKHDGHASPRPELSFLSLSKELGHPSAIYTIHPHPQGNKDAPRSASDADCLGQCCPRCTPFHVHGDPTSR